MVPSTIGPRLGGKRLQISLWRPHPPGYCCAVFGDRIHRLKACLDHPHKLIPRKSAQGSTGFNVPNTDPGREYGGGEHRNGHRDVNHLVLFGLNCIWFQIGVSLGFKGTQFGKIPNVCETRGSRIEFQVLHSKLNL